jgi:hypothetical protein
MQPVPPVTSTRSSFMRYLSIQPMPSPPVD